MANSIYTKPTLQSPQRLSPRHFGAGSWCSCYAQTVWRPIRDVGYHRIHLCVANMIISNGLPFQVWRCAYVLYNFKGVRAFRQLCCQRISDINGHCAYFNSIMFINDSTILITTRKLLSNNSSNVILRWGYTFLHTSVILLVWYI